MAIDNRDKRASALRFMLPWMIPLLPVPDDDVDEGDRAQVTGIYRDFDFDEPTSGGGLGGRRLLIGIID